MNLILSLHDVSPLTFAACRDIVSDLADAGVHTISLLVIPDHHHRGHFLADPLFCRWLQEMAGAGHEIVTHGYFHQREQTGRESLRDQMITRFYTASEGEFYDLGEEEASEKMRRAQADFATLNLHPTGFIAPAWLLSAPAERAACLTGFHYTTTLQEIRNLRTRAVYSSQSLVFSVRSAWRRLVSIGWNRSLLSRLTHNPVVRLAIHPPDWRFPAIRHEILQLTRHLAARRTPTTYAEWIAR